jgi:hypothetical protein
MKSPPVILHDHLPLIEVAETWILEVLLAESAPGVLVRLAERIAAVAPTHLEAFLVRLRQLGHTPKVVAE